MHCGTTIDTFLRENLDWLSRATNWAKFNATAGLGVIHRGHLKEVKPFLNKTLQQVLFSQLLDSIVEGRYTLRY